LGGEIAGSNGAKTIRMQTFCLPLSVDEVSVDELLVEELSVDELLVDISTIYERQIVSR
jgi:hypothetical protein